MLFPGPLAAAAGVACLLSTANAAPTAATANCERYDASGACAAPQTPPMPPKLLQIAINANYDAEMTQWCANLLSQDQSKVLPFWNQACEAYMSSHKMFRIIAAQAEIIKFEVDMMELDYQPPMPAGNPGGYRSRPSNSTGGYTTAPSVTRRGKKSKQQLEKICKDVKNANPNNVPAEWKEACKKAFPMETAKGPLAEAKHAKTGGRPGPKVIHPPRETPSFVSRILSVVRRSVIDDDNCIYRWRNCVTRDPP